VQAIVNALAHGGRWGVYGAGSGIQQSFNNADNAMSETNSDDGFSATKDGAAAEASVNAHGSELGEAVWLGDTMQAREAFMEFLTRMAPNIAMNMQSVTTPESFTISARWHHRRKAYAATLTCEGRIPNA
jgi:hypothetical protein